jgi:hypothetical protein
MKINEINDSIIEYKEKAVSCIDMIKFKYETNYYGYDKLHMNLVNDILEWQLYMLKLMDLLIERTRTKKEK